MSGVTLRAARSTDAGRVGGILSEFIDTTPWMPRIHTRAEDIGFAGVMIDKGWVTVAATGSDLAGFIASDALTVHALYVTSAARRQGIGSALLTHLQQSCDSLTLWTFQANTGAQAFYVAHGFEPVEHTDGSGNDEGLPDIRLVWKKEAA